MKSIRLCQRVYRTLFWATLSGTLLLGCAPIVDSGATPIVAEASAKPVESLATEANVQTVSLNTYYLFGSEF